MSDTKLFEVGKIFTPSAPINKKDLFSGRKKELLSIINAINQRGQHAILYGERGVGKTSLVNVIHEFIPTNEGYISVKVNADIETDYQSLFESILSEIEIESTKPLVGFDAGNEKTKVSLSVLAEGKSLNPNTLKVLFKQVLGRHIIIIIDEFDRIEDAQVRKLVADTIKSFSDYDLEITVILVGVADSVDTLISGHQSVERALVQTKMPRMSKEELDEILLTGYEKLGMHLEATVREEVITLSQGLPHYTHLLALYAAQDAIQKSQDVVTNINLEEAIVQALEKTQASVKETYYKAINSPRSNLYTPILLACAMAKKNEMGFFAATDIREPLKQITGKIYQVSAFARHLNEFCENKRGPILKRTGYKKSYRYRFINPMMEPFVIMDGLNKNLIWEEAIMNIKELNG